MTLNITIDTEELSLWAMIKFLTRIAVAAMPAYFVWVIVKSLVVPFWLMGLQNMVAQFRH